MVQLARPVAQCRISVFQYIYGILEDVSHSRFIVLLLHCVRSAQKQVTPPTPKTPTLIITFKAVSYTVRNCIFFLSVEKRIKRVYVF